jgi:transcriptional regulator CtsR
MARLSDIIENFIKAVLSENGGHQVQIQRNELAGQFKCAPSQINYVLTTRFTYDRGYVIESRRGGGGYIVIKQVINDRDEQRNTLITDVIGDSITNHNGLSIIEGLYESGLVNERELQLMKMIINDRTLVSAEDKNKVRADILKALLMVILS